VRRWFFAVIVILAWPLSAAELETKIPELPSALAAPVAAALPTGELSAQTLSFAEGPAPGASLVTPQISLTPAAASPAAQSAQGVAAQAALAQASAQPSQDAAPSASQFAAVADGGRPLDVMIVTAEAVPFAKTGGLADVTDAVARGLVAKGHRATLVLPNYKNLKKDGMTFTPRATISVPIGDRVETATILHAEREGVDIWLLDGALFNARDGPYAEKGVLHPDNDERMIMLTRGALEAAKAMGRKPDILHAHDWHSALIGPMAKKIYADDPAFANAKSVLTIHNIAYQGAFGGAALLKAGFGWEEFHWESMEHWGLFSFMKAGLQHSDAITTVSPTYAKEIQTPEFGVGFDGLLRYRAQDLHGIINGVDPKLWSPETDPVVARQYGQEDVARGKRENKTAVQMLAGFAEDPGAPLFAVASRFDHQKGVDLILEAIPDILAAGGQLVISGSGDPELEKAVKEAAAANPGRVFHHPFSEVFVHALYAAADFLLMPSRFEPCGLSQLIAQRFGAIPIVTPVGGLVDTVEDGHDGLVISSFSREALADGIARAKALHDDPDALDAMRQRAMKKDTSWGASIAKYVALFRSLLAR